jgi:type I restriction enzyme S subunit
MEETKVLHKKKILAPKLRFKEFTKGWNKEKLSSITTKISDGLHSTPNYDESGDYHFVNGNNLINGKIVISESTKKVNESEYLKHKKELTDKTILISINGTIGSLAIYNNEKVILGKSACYINLDNKADKYYIYYTLQTPIIQNFLNSGLTGSTIKNLSLTTIKNCEFPFPFLPEQQKIAGFLSSVDEKIQLLTRKKQLLQQYKKGVMQQLFSCKLRFKDANGKTYPKWEEKKLSEVVDVIDPHPSHRAPDAVLNGIPFIGIGDISTSGVVDFSNVRLVGDEIYEEHRKRYKIELGDFAYGRVASIGKVVGLDLSINERYSFSPTMAIIKPKRVNSIYIRFYMQSDNFIQIVESKTTGSTRKSLGVQNLRLIPIKIPIDKEQKKIADFLSAIDVKIENLSKQIDQTQNFKKGLLQQMFV